VSTVTTRAGAKARHSLVFEPERHVYTLDGVSAMPVTTAVRVIDKPALNEWKMREAACAVLDGRARTVEQAVAAVEAVAREAAAFGTALHAAAAAIARGHRLLALEINERWQPSVELLGNWFADNVLEVLAVEEIMGHPSLAGVAVAGKPDLLALLRGHRRPTVIDYKSGRGVYLGEHWQLGGYRILARYWLGLTCDRLILHLPAPRPGEQHTLTPVPLRNHPADELSFLNCVTLARQLEGVNY
jgi:hypothetical protein